jgi:hypothetical protein
VANAALAYDLGRNWRAGTRLVFYTGTPVINRTQGTIPLTPTISNDRNPLLSGGSQARKALELESARLDLLRLPKS